MSIVAVAKQAGVSYATVSRVINGRQGVSEETKNKVQQALRETGYIPPPKGRRRGPAVGARRGVQHGCMALIWTCTRAEAMSPVASSLLHGASAAAVKEGLNLLVDCVADTGLLPQIVESGKVDGLLIVGPEPSADMTEKLNRFPCVWMLSRGSELWGDRVQPDNAAIARLACEVLIRRGHTQLAVVTDDSPRATPAYGERAEHFVAQAEEVPLPVTAIRYNPAPEAGASQGEALETMLGEIMDRFAGMHVRPTGIFVASDIAVPLHHELLHHGIVPGRDVELVCCNRENLRAAGVKPSPVVINIQAELIGQLAVSRILWRLENPKFDASVRVLVHPEVLNPDEPSEFYARRDA